MQPEIVINVYSPDGTPFVFEDVTIEDTLAPELTFRGFSHDHQKRVRITTTLPYIIASKVTEFHIIEGTRQVSDGQALLSDAQDVAS